MGWTSQDNLIDDLTNNGQGDIAICQKTLAAVQTAGTWALLNGHSGIPVASTFATADLTYQATDDTWAEGCMQLEAVVQAPQVTVQPAQVHVDVPAPQVVVNNERPATRQLHRRDADGNLVETITQPLQ